MEHKPAMRKLILPILAISLLPLLAAKQFNTGQRPFTFSAAATPIASYVQSCSGTVATGNCALTGVAAGDLIVTCPNFSIAGVAVLTSISDGTSNLTLLPVEYAAPSVYSAIQCGYLLNANSGNRTYTFSFSPAAGGGNFIVAEFHSTSGSWYLDTNVDAPYGFNVGGANGTASSSGSLASITASGAEVIVDATQLSQVFATASSPLISSFTPTEFSLSPVQTSDHEYYLLNQYISSGAATLTYSTATNWMNYAVAFNAH